MEQKANTGTTQDNAPVNQTPATQEEANAMSPEAVKAAMVKVRADRANVQPEETATPLGQEEVKAKTEVAQKTVEEQQAAIQANSEDIGRLRKLEKMAKANNEMLLRQEEERKKNVPLTPTAAEVALQKKIETGEDYTIELSAVVREQSTAAAKDAIDAEKAAAKNQLDQYNEFVSQNREYLNKAVPNLEELMPVIVQVVKEEGKTSQDLIDKFQADPYSFPKENVMEYVVAAQSRIYATGEEQTGSAAPTLGDNKQKALANSSGTTDVSTKLSYEEMCDLPPAELKEAVKRARQEETGRRV